MSDLKLSISLLSGGKNEEYLEKCLSSLDIFKLHFDTEIVIVDTDPWHQIGIHKIIEKYADKIIRFKWIDDFSAARNAGMKECTGDWYLYIDDDEWFINAHPIIDFLNSDEVNEYTWVNIMRNEYLDSKYQKWSNTWCTRLIKLEPDTHFEGVVHEYLAPLSGKAKDIEAVLGHTGYMYLTQEEKDNKINRNIKLLHKAIDQNPKEMRWWLQLIQEYDASNQYEKIPHICKKSLKSLEKNTKITPMLRAIMGYFVSAWMMACRQLKDWDSESKVYNSYVKYKSYGKLLDSYLDMETALMFNARKDKQMTAEATRSYFRHYEEFQNGMPYPTDEMNFWICNTFHETIMNPMIILLIRADIADGHWESYEKYFDRLQWGGKEGKKVAGYFLTDMVQLPYDDRFADMLLKMWADNNIKPMIIGIVANDKIKDDPGYQKFLKIAMKGDIVV